MLFIRLNFSQLAVLCTDCVSLLDVLHLEATICASPHCRFVSTSMKRTMFWYVPCSTVSLLENVQKTNNLNVSVL